MDVVAKVANKKEKTMIFEKVDVVDMVAKKKIEDHDFLRIWKRWTRWPTINEKTVIFWKFEKGGRGAMVA